MLASDSFVPRVPLKGTSSININGDPENDGDTVESSRWTSWLHTCRNSRIITVEPAIFLFMFAHMVYIPLCEQYYYLRYGTQTLRNTTFQLPNHPFCLNSTEVDEYAGNGTYKSVETVSIHLVLFAQLANCLPSIFITMLSGPFSDKFGRKPALVAVGVGKTFQAVFTLMIIHFEWNPYYFILANFFSGVGGDFPAMIGSCFAYIADISTPKWRSFRFGFMQSMTSLGASLGQFTGGYWLNLINCNFMLPMWLNLACNVALILYLVFLLPESLNFIERKKIAEKSPKGLGASLQGLRMFFCKLPKYSNSVWKLWVSTISILLILITMLGLKYVNVYFLKAPPFDFSPKFIGLYQGVYSISAAMSTTVLVGILVAIKTPDVAISLIGVTFQGVCYLLTGFARRAYQILTIASFQGVDSITWIGLLGYRSKLIAPEDQGALFAIAAAVEAIATIVGTVLWTNVFAMTLKYGLGAGATFFFMAGCCLLNSLLILLLLVFGYKHVCRSIAKPIQNGDRLEYRTHSPGTSTSDQSDSSSSAVSPSEKDPLLQHTFSINNNK